MIHTITCDLDENCRCDRRSRWDRVEASTDPIVLLWHLERLSGMIRSTRLLWVYCYGPKAEYYLERKIERLKARRERCKKRYDQLTRSIPVSGGGPLIWMPSSSEK